MAVLRLTGQGDIVSSSQGDVASLNTSVNNLIIDEDSFATDSSTRAPSQQSTKAYIATQIASKDNTDEIAEGSTNLYFTDTRARAVSIENVSEDTTPQLGGDLDVNGNKITSASNGNIDIEPHGTGNVLIGNFTFDADQTVGASQDNFVLAYDATTGLISLEANNVGNLSNVVEDDTPQLGGNLDTNNKEITNAAGNDITITPQTAGAIVVNAGTGINLNGKQLFSSTAQGITRISTSDLTGAFSATKNIGTYSGTDAAQKITDLAKHVPIYFNVQGESSTSVGTIDSFNTGSITSVRTGATERELDLRLMDDDATNQIAQVILTRDSNGYHQTEIGNKAGDFRPPLNVIARTEGLSGSNQNAVPVIKITKETSNDSRRVPLVFTHLNSGTEHFLVNTFARESGSKKRFGINFLADDGSLLNSSGGSGYQGDMVEFSQDTGSNFECRQTLRGRLQIEHGSANIANTINMITALDSSDAQQNFLTATVTRGTGSTPDDTIGGTFSFKANNAAENSERFIGEIKFQYDDGAEAQNKVRIRTKSYDGNSNLGEITVSGQSADFTVPATMPTYAVGSLPTASIDAGAMAFATGLNSSDVSTGKAMVFYDGTNWKYMHLPATTARA